MEDHAHAGGMQGNTTEKFAGASQRHEGIDQADEVAPQRETQPKQWHVVFVLSWGTRPRREPQYNPEFFEFIAIWRPNRIPVVLQAYCPSGLA